MLVQKNSKEAYEILKKYVFSSDVYKRRYVLSVIFEYPDAIEIVDELEKALRTENAYAFMTSTILKVMIKYHIKIDPETVVQALKNSNSDYGWHYQLFEKDEQPHIRMVACEIAIQMNRQDLLMLFKEDKDGHIRKYVMKHINV